MAYFDPVKAPFSSELTGEIAACRQMLIKYGTLYQAHGF